MIQSEAGTKELRRLLDAVMSVGSDLELAVVLRHLTETAVELVGATFGALGVLDPDRAFLSDFITVGIDADEAAVIGELPKGHGILGLLISDPKPLRLTNLNEHPESFGFPLNHPPMTSFLGVPVFVRGEAYGNLYLTDKLHGEAFTDVDEEMMGILATAAGAAIENARLHAKVRDLDVVEDRLRIARDLHDTVIQRLFATGLALQGAARLAEPLPEVGDRIQQAVDELDQVVRQVRMSIFELTTAEASTDGLRRQLMAVGDEVADALGYAPNFRFEGPVDAAVSEEVASHLVAVVSEALANVVRHARSPAVSVGVAVKDGRLTATIEDEGIGFSGRRSGGKGLENLAQRADELGGASAIEARAEGGTRLRWWVPLPA